MNLEIDPIFNEGNAMLAVFLLLGIVGPLAICAHIGGVF